jgi:DNA-binding transcriptional regulator YbjK
MALITIDIDVDEFSLNDILKEVSNQYDRESKKKEITKFLEEMMFDDKPVLPNLSITDQIKFDLFQENFNRIDINDLELIIKK